MIAKERQGAKVSKKYDSAKTPFQRILLSEHISQEKKDRLTMEYDALDPVKRWLNWKHYRMDYGNIPGIKPVALMPTMSSPKKSLLIKVSHNLGCPLTQIVFTAQAKKQT